MKVHFLFLILLVFGLSSFIKDPEVYLTQSGKVHFKSQAPLEIIEASSNQLKGAIDIDKRTFAFTIEIVTFDGFNNPLQKEHFNENYLESSDYTTASFLGKIIEKTDLTKEGTYILRAKGKLNIHGITQERIIKSEVIVKDGKLAVQAKFTVLLKEHGIAIPKIVHQKIAEEIQVSIEAEFTRSSS